MLLANDKILMDGIKVGANCKLKLWKNTLESMDFRLSRNNMGYMECSFSKIRNKDEGGVKIEDHEILKSVQFWYLELIIYKF